MTVVYLMPLTCWCDLVRCTWYNK